jgi:hypothetical protein
MGKTRVHSMPCSVWALVPLLLATACSEEIDITPLRPPRGTFGEEVVAMLRKDLAREARSGPERAQAVDGQQAALVEAIDGLAPEPFHDPLQAMLVKFVDDGLYRDGVMPGVSRAFADALDLFASDPNLLKAWSWESHRVGQLPRRTRLLATLIGFADLRALTTALADFGLAHDGLDEKGAPAAGEPRELAAAIEALSRTLQTVDPGDPRDRTLADVVDLLMTYDERLTVDATPLWLVRRDRRGAFQVAPGSLGSTFRDGDGDDLADLDPLGRPRLADGTPFTAPAHIDTFADTHDGEGRALLPGGDGTEPAYDYLDVHGSVARVLLGDARPLLEKDILFDLPGFLPAIVSGGRRTERSQDGETFSVFDFSAESALLDVLWAFFQILDFEDAPALLEILARLMDEHPQAAAGTIEAIDQILDRADAHTEAQTSPGSTFLDDLLLFLGDVLEQPGLLAAILDDVQNLDVAAVAETQARLLSFADPFVTEATADRCRNNAASCERAFTQPVDPGAADFEHNPGGGPARRGNRSLFARALHLVADTYGASFSLELRVGPFDIPLDALLHIEDLATFYFEVIGGRGREEGADVGCISDFVAETTSFVLDIDLEGCMTPEQANRFMNTELPSLLPPPFDNEGYEIRMHHGDALFAGEIAGLPAGLKSLAATLSRNNATYLLPELFTLLHRHWTSPDAEYLQADGFTPDPSFHTNLRSYEPLLIDVFTQTDSLRLIQEAGVVLADMRLADGRRAVDVVERAVRHLMLPDPTVVRRDGTSASTRGDGASIDPMSRFYLLRDALDGLDVALDAQPGVRDAWDRVTDELIDLFIDTALDPPSGRYVFRNPNAPVVTAHLVEMLRENVAARAADGTLHEALGDTWPTDMEDFLGGRGLAATHDLLAAIAADGTLKRLLHDATLDLTAPANLDDLTLRVLELLLDMYEYDPRPDDPEQDARGYTAAAAAWGRAISYADGGARLVFNLLRFLRRAAAADGTEDRMGTFLRNAVEPNDEAHTYHLFVLGRAIKRDQRVDPLAAGPLDVDDYDQMLRSVTTWLRNEQVGAEQLYDLIQKNRP